MINENMSNWEETKDRYIAFIDIMGFSDYVYRNKHSVVKKRMTNLHEILASTEKAFKSVTVEEEMLKSEIRTTIFSDSILIITRDDSNDSLASINLVCKMFMAECMNQQIPLKGAISYGTVTADFDKSLFFGKGLIDAYSLQEQLFMYGIVLDNKIEKRLKKNYDATKIDGLLCQSLVATKSGLITHYVVDWMNWLIPYEEFVKDKENQIVHKHSIPVMEKFFEDMSGYPRKYIDNTIEHIKRVYWTCNKKMDTRLRSCC
jgi:hypothetical protein